MRSFELTYAEGHLKLCLEGIQPEIKQLENGSYCLSFHPNNNDIFEAVLDSATLQELGRACVPHIRMPAVFRTTPETEKTFRQRAFFIKELSDLSIQRILRELCCVTVEIFLWYMKDAELMRKILRNMSQLAAEMVMRDIEKSWEGHDPDTANKVHICSGREAVCDVLEVVERLSAEKQIEIDQRERLP